MKKRIYDSEYIFDLSSPKAGHTPGRSVRGGARRDSGTRRRRTTQNADGTFRPRENSSSYSPDNRRMTSWVCIWDKINLSSQKPGHTTDGPGRGARRGGGAGSSKTERRQNISPRRHASLVLPNTSKTRLLNISSKARTSKIPLVESKTRTYHGRVGTGRRTGTAGPGLDGQHRTPTERFAQEKTALFTLQTMEE